MCNLKARKNFMENDAKKQQISKSLGSCFCCGNIFSLFSFFRSWILINHSVSYYNMGSIVNCSLGKAFGGKCHKLTHTKVKQENLAEMEIWARTFGYTGNCKYAPLQVLRWQCTWDKIL